MPDPCKQEETVKRLDQDIREILKDIRVDQRRQTSLLENMARQDERIKTHTDILGRQQESLNEAFGRLRKLEAAPGSTASRALWVVFGAGCSVLGGMLLLLFSKGLP